MDVVQALKQLERDGPQPLYVLQGGEGHLVTSFLRRLREVALAGGVEALNVSVYRDESVELAEVLAAARQLPMLAERRIVIVRADAWLGGEGKLEARDAALLEQYLEQPVPTTSLVLTVEQLDRRLRLAKRLEQVAVIVDCAPRSPGEVAAWLRQAAAGAGGRITPAAAQLLVERVGTDLRRLRNELDKLLAYAGKDAIDPSHVVALVAEAAEGRIFSLLDALFQRRSDAAQRELQRLLDGGEPPLRILAMLHRQIRQAVQIKALKERGATAEAVQKQLRLHPFVARKLFRQMDRWTLDEAVHALLDAVAAEAAVKTGRLDPEVALQLLVARWAGRLPVRRTRQPLP
ncbi:MAG TPA: DNA polymerase III subunit delta [Bacillota bacterium]